MRGSGFYSLPQNDPIARMSKRIKPKRLSKTTGKKALASIVTGRGFFFLFLLSSKQALKTFSTLG